LLQLRYLPCFVIIKDLHPILDSSDVLRELTRPIVDSGCEEIILDLWLSLFGRLIASLLPMQSLGFILSGELSDRKLLLVLIVGHDFEITAVEYEAWLSVSYRCWGNRNILIDLRFPQCDGGGLANSRRASLSYGYRASVYNRGVELPLLSVSLDVSVVSFWREDGLTVLRAISDNVSALLVDDWLVRCPLTPQLLQFLIVFFHILP
jgi:hypothetical protein